MKFLIFVIAAIMMVARGTDTTSWGINHRSTRYQRSSINKNNVDTLKVKWVTTLPGPILNSPAVVGNRLYIGDHFGGFSALNKHTGQIIYQKNLTTDYGFPNKTNSRHTPVYVDGLIVMPTSGRWGAPGPTTQNPDWGTSGGAWMTVLNAVDGSVRWSKQVTDFFRGIVTGSPTVENGVIYFGISSNEELEPLVAWRQGRNYTCCEFVGRMMALNLYTGEEIWKQRTIPEELSGVGKYSGASVWMSGPSILGDYIYFATGNLHEVPADVKECYLATPNNISCTDPRVLFDAVLKVNKHTGEIVASRRFTPQDVWHTICRYKGTIPGCPFPIGQEGPDADFGNAPMLTKPDKKGNVYIAIGQKLGVLWYLNATDLSIVWHVVAGPSGNFGGMQYGSTMNDDGQIFIAQANSDVKNHTTIYGERINYGSWLRVNPDGKVKWETKSPTQDRLPGAMTSTNNVVFASTMSGTLTSLSAIDGEILWRFVSGTQTIAAPSIDERTIYWGTGYTSTYSTGVVPQPCKLYAFELTGH